MTRTKRRLSIQLSPRELDVLQKLANGFSQKEIAYKLGISYKTVKRDTNQIRTKYGCVTLQRAVAIAIKTKLIRVWVFRDPIVSNPKATRQIPKINNADS